MLRRLGAVQLDTISVLARSHELVAYARLGAVGAAKVEKAYWSGGAFEYWSHAACVLPVEEWPMFGFRRRYFRDRGWRWHEVPQDAGPRVLDALRANGPMTVTELGGARRGGEWWDWSDVKIAVEWLLDVGDVVCTERRAWKRVYDLPERALPPEVLADDPDDETVPAPAGGPGRRRARRGDDRRPGRLPPAQARSGPGGARRDRPRAGDGRGLARRRVGGSRRRWRRSRRAGAIAPRCCRPSTRSCGTARGRCASSTSSTGSRPTSRRPSACTATSPCRCWRAGACAGASTRAATGRRSWPSGCRASPARSTPMAQALREAAEWVGCDAVALETVDPPAARPAAARALA